jgi:TPR repeat protein
VDQTKAARFFEQASAAHHAGAQRSLGYLLMDGLGVPEDKPRAIELWEAAARGGDRFAQLNLGLQYASGKTVAKDPARAIPLLTAAAEQGMTNAMAGLGDVLAGLDRDAEARAWYVKAAERGHGGAMSAVAQWYRDAIGGPRDRVQAARWYWAMLATGNADGVHEVLHMAPDMTDAELREAARQAGDPTYAEALLASQATERATRGPQKN